MLLYVLQECTDGEGCKESTWGTSDVCKTTSPTSSNTCVECMADGDCLALIDAKAISSSLTKCNTQTNKCVVREGLEAWHLRTRLGQGWQAAQSAKAPSGCAHEMSGPFAFSTDRLGAHLRLALA